MPEPGKSDRWNSLLETLGVAAPEPPPSTPPEASLAGVEPTPPPAPKPVSMLPPEKARPAPKPKPAPAPAKSPSYWSRIAGALGLETTPEPEAEPAPPAAQTPSAPPPRAPEPRPSRPRSEPPRSEPPRSMERPPERPARQAEPSRSDDLPARAFDPPPPPRTPSEPTARSPLDSMFGSKEPDLDVFGLEPQTEGPPQRQAPPPRRRDEERREAEPRGPVLEYDLAGAADLSLPEESSAEGAPRGERGDRDEGEGRRRRRRRGRGRRGRSGETSDMLPPRRAEDAPPPELEADFDVDRDDELELGPALDDDFAGPGFAEPQRPAQQRDTESGERSERGGRRRRGRGRGSRDRDRGETEAERPAGFGPPDFDEDELPAGPPRSVRRPAPQGELDEQDDLAGEEGDEEHAAGVPTHKKIPTWDEAVGILIEANMAARANSPDRDRGGRGRGGRGRGGRR